MGGLVEESLRQASHQRQLVEFTCSGLSWGGVSDPHSSPYGADLNLGAKQRWYLTDWCFGIAEQCWHSLSTFPASFLHPSRE